MEKKEKKAKKDRKEKDLKLDESNQLIAKLQG